MKVLVSGATGLVGSAVVASLQADGHEAVRLGRKAVAGSTEPMVAWDPAQGELDAAALEGLDAVVHLAGENIAGGRWNDAMKRKIADSRIQGTKLLCETLAGLKQKPQVLVSASAIGFYGDRGDEILDEESAPTDTFLADVCRQWEDATAAAREAGIRVVNLRIGVVLSRKGGALHKMLLPFKMCAGGVVGSGKQWWSWIAREDLVGVIRFAIENETLSGPVNAVSPDPTQNYDFTKTLGRVLRRPTIAPLPAFVVRLLMGEMGDELLLASSRVVPKRLEEAGYHFRCATLDAALTSALNET